MFAIVMDQRLYLKVDAQSRPEFEQLGLAAMTYEAKGKAVKLSYFEAPDAIMDCPQQAADWARRAFDAALRVQAKRLSKPRKKFN